MTTGAPISVLVAAAPGTSPRAELRARCELVRQARRLNTQWLQDQREAARNA